MQIVTAQDDIWIRLKYLTMGTQIGKVIFIMAVQCNLISFAFIKAGSTLGLMKWSEQNILHAYSKYWILCRNVHIFPI